MTGKKKNKTSSKKSIKAKASRVLPKASSRSNPKTMDEVLSMYGGSVKGLSRGDKVTGVIVSISPKRVVIDIGGKSEGVVAEKAYTEAKDYIKTLKVGDTVTCGVIIPETYNGITILSFRAAAADASWRGLQKAKEKGQAIVVSGKSVSSAGVMVETYGVSGFVPKSQLGKEAAKNPRNLIDEYFKVKIIELDRKRKKLVLSEREVSDSSDIEKIAKALVKIKVGDTYNGVVTTLTNFGCFVEISVGSGKSKVALEGLVHISELSWGKITHSKEVVSEGMKVKVRVLGKENGKLALSIKHVKKDPWEEVSKKYKKDAKLKGKVVRVSDFGVFVELEEGIEGLVHMTKIPPGKKLSKGEEVNVYIEEIDIKSKKISLGLVLTEKPVGYR